MRRKKGFTLLELMIVIAIIGLLIAIVIPDLLKTRESAEIESCKASLRGVQSALELYYTHYKYYPDNLLTPINEGYLQENGDKDPWGKTLRYRTASGGGSGAADEAQGAKTANNYLIGSDGPDGKQDTDDDVEPPINTKRHSFKTNKGSADSSGEAVEGVTE
jgi:general secretion pathway protein G